MSAPLMHPKLLLGEGKEDVQFFKALLTHLGISNIQIESFDGKTNLGKTLKTLKLRPGFQDLVSLGITRDADFPNDPNEAEAVALQRAFQSVCSLLKNNQFSVPPTLASMIPGTPAVGVFIFPDCTKAGMLEDLCLSSIHQDIRTSCIEAYFTCIEQRTNRTQLRRNYAKSRVNAWLTTQEEPDKRLGEAALSGYWDFNHAAFDQLKQFLQNL